MDKIKGYKVFISYKYADSDVQMLNGRNDVTVRDYVNILQDYFEESPHIFKAEEDDNDLSRFKDETIESKLRDKIYDSSITLVLISKNMIGPGPEEDQWIPWEISYSLKEHSRNDRTSKSNAILAIVIPDIFGSYDYFFKENTCPICHCMTLQIEILFRILKLNMFNIKETKAQYNNCNNHTPDNKPYVGYPSYIHTVKWVDFTLNSIALNRFLDLSVAINSNIEDYIITKE